MISNIIIFSIIGIVIVVMVAVVLLYWKRINKDGRRKQDKEEQDMNNDEKRIENSESIEIIEKIVHETIPALRDDYMKQINALNDKISNIEADVSLLKASLKTEEKPKEEEISVNIIGVETEKGIELIFLSEDIKVPKRLIPNAEEVQENIEDIKEEESHLSTEELEKITIDSIKNGNTRFTSIIHAIQEKTGEEIPNFKMAFVLKRLIKSGKVIKSEDKTYSIPQK